MKLYDYFFYNLYDWYSDEYSIHKSRNPAVMAAIIITVSMLGWIIILKYILFNWIFKIEAHSYDNYALSAIGFIIAGFLVSYYDEDRYFQIKKRYAESGNPFNIKKRMSFSFAILLLPFVLALVLVFLK